MPVQTITGDNPAQEPIYVPISDTLIIDADLRALPDRNLIRADAGSTVENRGLLVSDIYAINASGFPDTGVQNRILNSGEIVSSGSDGSEVSAVAVCSYDSLIENSGSIRAEGWLTSAISVSDIGWEDERNAVEIVNSGEIISDGYIGLYLSPYGTPSLAFPDAGLSSIVVNAGVIQGGTMAIHGAAQRDEIVNQGLIVGDVKLRSGDDFLNSNGGRVEGRVYGGGGDDWIKGSRGKDFIVGNMGDDTLRGGQGSDILKGHGGDDVIFGGRGRDKIVGGPGADVLSGGRGPDRFVFRDADDSRADAPDVIDASGHDRFDFRALDLEWGETIWTERRGGVTEIHAETAEGDMLVLTDVRLDQGDFLL